MAIGALLDSVSEPPDSIFTVSVSAELAPTVQVLLRVMACRIVQVSPGVAKVEGEPDPLVQLESVVTAPDALVTQAVANDLTLHSKRKIRVVKCTAGYINVLAALVVMVVFFSQEIGVSVF